LTDQSAVADAGQNTLGTDSGQPADNSTTTDPNAGQSTDNGTTTDPNAGQLADNSTTGDPNAGQSTDSSASTDANAGQLADSTSTDDPNAGQVVDSGMTSDANAATTNATAVDAGQSLLGTDSGLSADNSTLAGSTSVDSITGLNASITPVDVTPTPLPFPASNTISNGPSDSIGMRLSDGIVQGMTSGTTGSLSHGGGSTHDSSSSALSSGPDTHAVQEAQQRAAADLSRLALQALTAKKDADHANPNSEQHTDGPMGKVAEDETRMMVAGHDWSLQGHAAQWAFMDRGDEGGDGLALTLETGGTEVHAARVIPGEASGNAGVPLPESDVTGAGLLSGATAGDSVALDVALEEFVRQIGDLGEQFGRSLSGLGVAPWVLTTAMAATTFELTRRRRSTRFGLGLAGGDQPSTLTWFGGLPGSLSTE
jgi:hypothetical protein